ncbi:hypothetical protein MC885_006451 [Smutsia gigantea]|nr:hypothetical protein MC885_006451 [Smutsia gigantea]
MRVGPIQQFSGWKVAFRGGGGGSTGVPGSSIGLEGERNGGAVVGVQLLPLGLSQASGSALSEKEETILHGLRQPFQIAQQPSHQFPKAFAPPIKLRICAHQMPLTTHPTVPLHKSCYNSGQNPSPDPLPESESEEEENANYLNESSGEEWDSSEEEDPVVPNLTPLESLAWQVKCLLKYSTTWKPLNPNSWLYHAKLLDPSTPVHIFREIGLRLSHCSHCVPKLEPIPEWPPLAFCGVPPFQKPLTSASRLSRDHATLNGALQFATKQLSRTLSRATPTPEYLKQIPNSCVSGCCCGWLTKTVKETTRTEPINTTYSYTDFQKAVNKLLTASL